MTHDPNPIPPPGPDDPPAQDVPEHDPPVFPERDARCGSERRSNGVLFEKDRPLG
jgi:hypothetical protein